MKLRLKRRGQALIAILCSLILVLSVIPVHAEDEASLKGKTSDLQDQLSGINQNLLAISKKISTSEMQVEITNSEILRTKDSLTAAEADEEKQYDSMKARIKYMYETGNATLLEMLFSAKNMADFLNKADFIQNISSYDRKMLHKLEKTRKDIANKKSTLEAQKNSIEAIQKDLSAQQAELEQEAKATSTNLAAYKVKLEKLQAEKAEKARLAAEKAAKEAAQKAAQEAAAQANANKPQNHSDNSNSGGSSSGNTSGDTNSGGSYDDTVVNNGATHVDASEVDILAAIIQCEAMQDYDSMLAVATVIMNRVDSPSFPDSISGVVYADGQFEPVWTGRLDTVLSSGATDLAYKVAKDAIAGARLSAVTDCYYFLYAGATDRPGVNIGNNLFFPSW